MTKRLLIAGGLLLAVVLVLVVSKTRGTGEPMYEGIPLSRWMEGHVASSAANPPYNSPGWLKADEAMRKIGTNGIPVLLKMISAKDPPRAVLQFLEWAQQRRLPFIHYRHASSRNDEARYAFEKLGPGAGAAVPGLIKIYEQDVSPYSKICVAAALGSIGRPAEPALPALFKDFTDPDGQTRFEAVSAFANIGGDPKVVFPALVSVLKDPKIEIRWNAVVGLSNYGARGRAVVPALLEALQDPARIGTDPLKGQIEIALWRIAPEKVGKPLVVEDATPIISEGRTTEPVDVLFNGKRNTLIPTGKTVPAVAQFWNSNPQGSLTLYRGKGGPNTEEHFLGEFEVLGIPPGQASVNVSVLCVIAGQQIFLCARDNNQNIFLEMRRVK